jgi:hypothetical protein
MLRVTTSIVIAAPRDLVSEIYADCLACRDCSQPSVAYGSSAATAKNSCSRSTMSKARSATSCSCDRPTTSSYGKTNATTARCSGTSFGRFPAGHDSP